MATQEEKATTTSSNGRTGNLSDGKRQKITYAVAAMGIVVLALIGQWFLVGRHRIETDDAFIDGHVLPVSSKVAGQAVTVNVADNQPVKKGDLLVEIDSADYRLKLEQAQAEEAAAAALAKQTGADASRARNLFSKGAVSEQVRDKAVS